MSSSDQRSLNERRASFRCPVNGPRRGGRMRIGKREISIEVLDESAGGYSIVGEQEFDCEIGQSLLLQIGSSWTIVRIMNVQKLGSSTRLGVLRLKDLDASEVEPELRIELSLKNLKRLALALSPLWRTAGGIVALVVGGALLGVGVMVALERSASLAGALEHDEESGHIADMTAPDPALGEVRTSDEEPEFKHRKKRTVTPPTPADPGEEDSKPKIEPTAIVEQPRRTAASETPAPEHVLRHSHPGLLLKPEFVKLLNLTHDQIVELRRLFEETRSSTAARLAANSEGTDAEYELAREVGKRTLAVLTPAQRETIKRMLSNGKAAESSGAAAGANGAKPAE